MKKIHKTVLALTVFLLLVVSSCILAVNYYNKELKTLDIENTGLWFHFYVKSHSFSEIDMSMEDECIRVMPTYEKVEITELESRLYLKMFYDLYEKFEQGKFESKPYYKGQTTFCLNAESENERCEFKIPTTNSLLTNLMYFSFYLRTFYPYLFGIWFALAALLVVTQKRRGKIQATDTGKNFTPHKIFAVVSAAYLAVGQMIFSGLRYYFYRAREEALKKTIFFAGREMRMRDLRFDNFEFHTQDYMLIPGIILLVIQIITVFKSNKEKKREATAFALPTLLFSGFIYEFVWNFWDTPLFGYLDTISHKYLSLYHITPVHFFAFYYTMLVLVGIAVFLIFNLACFWGKKSFKENLRQAMVYSFVVALTAVVPCVAGRYYF